MSLDEQLSLRGRGAGPDKLAIWMSNRVFKPCLTFWTSSSWGWEEPFHSISLESLE